MRWLSHRNLLFLVAFSFLMFYFVSMVNAAPFYPTHPTYFPSKAGSYINFNASLQPISFSTLYRNTLTRWYFNDTWATSTVDMTITVFHSNGWINYTVAGAGTQEVNNGSQPSTVYIDGVNKTLGDGWTYSSGTVTVTAASSSVALGGVYVPPPLTQVEAYVLNLYMILPLMAFVALPLIGAAAIIGLKGGSGSATLALLAIMVAFVAVLLIVVVAQMVQVSTY